MAGGGDVEVMCDGGREREVSGKLLEMIHFISLKYKK